MIRSLLNCLAGLAILLGTVRNSRAEVTPDEVRDAIAAGVRYLKSQQLKDRGNWPDRVGYPGGVTALCTLALLESGEPLNSPAMDKALAYLRQLGDPQAVYVTALQTMVFCTAEPKKDMLLIQRNADWLARAQIMAGERAGAWTYFSVADTQARGDNSNSQFALLGLHEAEQAGGKVDDAVWQRALDYWLSCQRADGAWSYYKALKDQPETAPTGSMTCAGIGALVISQGRLSEGDARVVDGTIRCCCEQTDDDQLQRALEWLGAKFTVNANPSPAGFGGINLGRSGLFYYLYGVERVGRLTGRRFLGQHDWYRQGAEMLVQQQDKLSGFWRGEGSGEENPLIATSFALLFLSKGRRPVAISKLQHGYTNDWDLHRSGVHNLIRHVEPLWRQKLTWQTIDARAAGVEDLLESPVLFLSGREALDLTVEQKQNLKQYVAQGGFIFAEACCDGEQFDQAFRQLMKELFPDSALRLLPPEHVIWFAQERVAPDRMRPLYGIDACCRTSVVYCPKDLSCLWELSRGERETGYPQAVKDDIQAGLAIGANVLAYATNRQLKDKLERPRISTQGDPNENVSRGVLVIPKLVHGGGSDEAANALPRLLGVLRTEVGLRVAAEPLHVSPDDPQLLDHTVAFIHGRRDFRFSEKQRKALATYLRRGGFLFGDAICANGQFADALRREIKAALPEAEFVRLPEDHPLFTQQFRGYDLSTVTLRDPQVRAAGDPLNARQMQIKPLLEGVQLQGRLAVVFSPYDISCAMENAASLDCKGYLPADAARLVVNIVMYALQQ
jgi:hypothetical protein